MIINESFMKDDFIENVEIMTKTSEINDSSNIFSEKSNVLSNEELNYKEIIESSKSSMPNEKTVNLLNITDKSVNVVDRKSFNCQQCNKSFFQKEI